MLGKIGMTLLLLVSTLQAWAVPEARLLSQSSSGQTVLFNLGIHDGVKEGDFAVIVKPIRALKQRDLKVIPVAKARNIKINTESSVWILYKIFDQELLQKGDKFLILSESVMLNGRKIPRMGKVTVVNQKSKVTSQTKHLLNDDKDRLSKLKKNYDEIAPTHEQESKPDTDVDLVNVDVWRKSEKNRYRSALYKSPHKNHFRRQLRLSTFEKLVTAYLKKVNDPDFSYDTFYDQQMKSEFANEFRKNSDYDTEYSNFIHEQSQKTTADAKLFRSILERGGSWSEDYSDEELHRVLNEVSILQEKDRRTIIATKATTYAFAFDYGFHINDAQTDQGSTYRRDRTYSTEIDFEATPFVKHVVLERFTLNGSFRLNRSAVAAGSVNADVDEYSATIGANWYPLYAPYTVEVPVFLFGAYIRSGYAKLTAPAVNEKANYTVLSTPGFRAGIKYNMRNHFQLRAIMGIESMRLDQYEASSFTPILPDQTNLVEVKVGFGLGYTF